MASYVLLWVCPIQSTLSQCHFQIAGHIWLRGIAKHSGIKTDTIERKAASLSFNFIMMEIMVIPWNLLIWFSQLLPQSCLTANTDECLCSKTLSFTPGTFSLMSESNDHKSGNKGKHWALINENWWLPSLARMIPSLYIRKSSERSSEKKKCVSGWLAWEYMHN